MLQRSSHKVILIKAQFRQSMKETPESEVEWSEIRRLEVTELASDINSKAPDDHPYWLINKLVRHDTCKWSLSHDQEDFSRDERPNILWWTSYEYYPLSESVHVYLWCVQHPWWHYDLAFQLVSDRLQCSRCKVKNTVAHFYRLQSWSCFQSCSTISKVNLNG